MHEHPQAHIVTPIAAPRLSQLSSETVTTDKDRKALTTVCGEAVGELTCPAGDSMRGTTPVRAT